VIHFSTRADHALMKNSASFCGSDISYPYVHPFFEFYALCSLNHGYSLLSALIFTATAYNLSYVTALAISQSGRWESLTIRTTTHSTSRAPRPDKGADDIGSYLARDFARLLKRLSL
jgi:hypothetical protein